MMKSKNFLLTTVALTALLALLPAIISAQDDGIWIDGKQVGNRDPNPSAWKENFPTDENVIEHDEYLEFLFATGLYYWRYTNHDSVDTATVNSDHYLKLEDILYDWHVKPVHIVSSNYVCGYLINVGTITNATVNGGELYNDYGGTITNATLNSGKFLNFGTITNATVNGDDMTPGGTVFHNYGTIDTATANYLGGDIDNYGTITTAITVNLGWLYNRKNGTIDTAMINSGGGWNFGTITDTTININDGSGFFNWDGGVIHNATVNDGALNNGGYWYGYYRSNGTIENATVNGGELNNYGGNTITNTTINGGTLNNGGQIDNMTYVAGGYNGQTGNWGYDDNWYWGWQTFTGTIGTLTLAGDSALNTGDWGNIGNLVFDKDGNGIATLTAFANEGGFGFAGIKADYVDFTNGNISLDFSGFVDISRLFDGFYLSTLFGATDFSGVEYLNSLGVIWGNDLFWILNGDGFGKGWSIDAATGFVSYEVPEPATLLMLGLGLAGLPIVRRYRKR